MAAAVLVVVVLVVVAAGLVAAAEPGRAVGGVVGLSDLKAMRSIVQVRRREHAAWLRRSGTQVGGGRLVVAAEAGRWCCRRCSNAKRLAFGNNHGGGHAGIVSQGQMQAGHPKLVDSGRHRAAVVQGRPAGRVVLYPAIQPTKIPRCSKSLGQGLFGGETRRQRTRRQPALSWHKQPFRQTWRAGQRPLDPNHLNDIQAQAHNHTHDPRFSSRVEPVPSLAQPKR